MKMISRIKNKVKYLIDKPPLPPIEQLTKITFKPNQIDVVFSSEIKNINELISRINNNHAEFCFYQLKDKKRGKGHNCTIINKYTFDNVFSHRAFIYVYNSEPCSFPHAINISNTNDFKHLIDSLIKDGSYALFANYNNHDTVCIRTGTFLNEFGTNYYNGGAERYHLDLYDVLKKMGVNMDIYQNSDIPFFRKYKNINVIGICDGVNDEKSSYTYADKQTKGYIYKSYTNTQLHIYSAFTEAYPNHLGPSIGISHGVSWDNSDNKDDLALNFWDKRQHIIASAMFCDKLISVDTNTANWFQTINYKLSTEKIKVIPNYVDTKIFKPDTSTKKDEIVITYPRRLYEARGFYLIAEIIPELLDKYHNIVFQFVGKGDKKAVRIAKHLVKKYPNKVKYYFLPPEKMHEAYEKSDISIIPTICSEGTSLSCLEALASGNIVIASRVGGLSDLIINGLNGFLIEPNKESLKESLEYCIDNFNKLSDIKKIAVKTAKSFNKKIWEERWQKVFNGYNLKKSNNIDLVEFHLESIDSITPEVNKKIIDELRKNKLVYLVLEKMPEEDTISHDRIQLVPRKEESVSVPTITYYVNNNKYKERLKAKKTISI